MIDNIDDITETGFPRVGQRNILSNNVRSSNIELLSFSKAQGGTLTLGGSSNGNGSLIIKNAAGSTIVLGDRTGLTVYNGNIAVQNDGGNNSFDSKGIVSLQNFSNSTNSAVGGSQTITATSDTDISGATLSFVCTRSTLVFILQTVQLFQSSANAGSWGLDGYITIYVDSVAHGLPIQYRTESNGTYITGAVRQVTATSHSLNSYSAGSHTIQMKARIGNTGSNGEAMNVFSYQLSYFLLGT